MDWNFLKRYKKGYMLWVPANLPDPNGDDAGHDVWAAVPEQDPPEMRAHYWLHSEYDLGAEEVTLITAESHLAHRCTVAGPTEQGVGHGIEDANEDGEFDGIKIYESLDSDPGGIWRGMITAADQGGYHSPHWRTHDAVRMPPVNQGHELPSSANYGGNSIGIKKCAQGAVNTARTMQQERTFLKWQGMSMTS